MSEKEMIQIYVSAGNELSTAELYDRAVAQYGVDVKYDDHKHHIRTMQQHLKNKGILVNTRRGFWALVS